MSEKKIYQGFTSYDEVYHCFLCNYYVTELRCNKCDEPICIRCMTIHLRKYEGSN